MFTIMKQHRIFQIIGLLFIFISCVEPYEAETEIFEDVLVVEAMITNEIKHQEITLSRSYRFENDSIAFEKNATVKVIENNNITFEFFEENQGKYVSKIPFNAKSDQTYQLIIKTNSGKSFTTDPIKLIESNVTNNLKVFRETNKDTINGMAMYIESVDPVANDRYYKFEYEETFKIIAPNWYHFDLIAAPNEADGLSVEYRKQEERVCFKTEKSNEIVIKNAYGIGNNKIDPFVVKFVPSDDYSLINRYSLLVKQYVLSRGTYVFYKTLKDFSESESLFSENQPGFISGNIYSSDNSNEKVVGFFSVSKVFTKRIFFNFSDYYEYYEAPDYPNACEITSPSLKASLKQPLSLWQMVKNNEVKFQIENDDPKQGESIYYVVPRICGDCTVLGSNIVPDFWVE